VIQSFQDFAQRSHGEINKRTANIQKHDDHIQKIQRVSEERDELIQLLRNRFGDK
jgi:hypothetical protein